MSDVIERIKKRIKILDKFHDGIVNLYEAIKIIDEESAKEPQEEPNIPLECVDGSCPIALSEEYEEYGMDIVHNCEECPYQPQVQPIARSAEEIAKMLHHFRRHEVNCFDCMAFKICARHSFDAYSCEQVLIDWLTGKEVE